jgi:hypothetical protein
MATRTTTIQLGGGLDLASDYLSVKPGRCLGARNMEPGAAGGYGQVLGIEAFDGHPSPSEQTYLALTVDTISGLALMDEVTGDSSGATGTVIGLDPDTLKIGLTKVTGTFSVGENLEVLGAPEAQIAVVNGPGLGPSDLDASWLLTAQALYRLDIERPEGAGSIMGLHVHRNGVSYCVRNNLTETNAVIHKSSGTGWAALSFQDILLFDAGAGAEIEIGDTVVGDPSAASAEVLNVVLYSGAWGVDAAGYLVLDTITGGPFDDMDDLKVGGITRAVADGPSYVFEFPPATQKFRFKSHNFYALDPTYAVYGVSGTGPAFELRDDGVLTPVLYPPLADAPTNNTPYLIEVHRNHLFLGFDNGNVQHCVQGNPTLMSGFLGAAEFGLGAPLTAIVSASQEMLTLQTSRSTHGLYGNNIDDWRLDVVSPDTGAVLDTSQVLMSVIALDDRGLVYLPRTNAYGNFEAGTVSRAVRSFLNLYKERAVGSVLVRDKNQYRLFFDDGLFLIVYLREDFRADLGVSFEYMFGDFGIVPTALANGEDADGNEVILFGDADGWVYRMEKGKNLDGESMEHWLQLPFAHSNDPRSRKRYRRAVIDFNSATPFELRMSADLNYGQSTTIDTKTVYKTILTGPGGQWGNIDWGTFYWNGQEVSTMLFPMTGVGVNASLTFYWDSASAGPVRLNSVQIDYTPRRRDRDA